MKRNLVGIFALVLAIGFSSFTSKRALDKWFRYDGTNNTGAQVLDPARYTDVGAADPGNPANSQQLLAFIHVEESTEVHASGTYVGKPTVDISSPITTDLNNNVVGKSSPIEITDRIYVK